VRPFDVEQSFSRVLGHLEFIDLLVAVATEQEQVLVGVEVGLAHTGHVTRRAGVQAVDVADLGKYLRPLWLRQPLLAARQGALVVQEGKELL
jgi:hypothetical protein